MPLPKDPLKQQQWRDNQADAQRGRSRNVGIHNPFYGKHHTEETRRLIGLKSKGRKRPLRGASINSIIPKGLLENLYIEQKLSRSQIRKQTGYSDWAITKALELYGIQRRNRHDMMIIVMQSRPIVGKISSGGYVQILKHDHPKANYSGYVWEHLLVWEQGSGRSLPDGWVIHHINGKKDDNRFENLLALPRRSHHGMLLLQAARKRVRELEATIASYKNQLPLMEAK